MKTRTKIIAGSAGILVLVAGGLAFAGGRGTGEREGARTVTVSRGDVIDRALAVGSIEPDVSVSVKSKVSGVVSRAYAEPGDYVKQGSPLLEIRPDPTPLELVEARRDVEMQDIELDDATTEVKRQRELADRGLIAAQALDAAERAFDEATLRSRMAHEKLQLLESGRIRGSQVESVVRAPISGAILERSVETGDPVVPLTSYQEGTVLMTMADMGKLLFKGTVDEIDVGRLEEGMPAEIKIGALPDAKVTGTVSRISLMAQKEESATTFPLEIALDSVSGVTLRAGLSANAEIIIQRRENVLIIPERTVTFEGDSAWVTVLNPDGTTARRTIETGLSDAVQVEVVNGLSEGDKVLEKAAGKV